MLGTEKYREELSQELAAASQGHKPLAGTLVEGTETLPRDPDSCLLDNELYFSVSPEKSLLSFLQYFCLDYSGYF